MGKKNVEKHWTLKCFESSCVKMNAS